MSVFSIKDIEAVSGIRCHTLRVWEQRYGIIQPKRTESNIRYFDDADLRYILNISILNKNGFKISEIAKMSKEDIKEAILCLTTKRTEYDKQIKGLISSMLSFDEFTFNQILTTAMVQIGLEQTMLSIVFPFLNEVGILWQVGSLHPSHEHFASNIIKQKLYVAIDGNGGRISANSKRFFLFLPENEQHSLGLLFANYVLRSRNHEVLYLGQEVPMTELCKVSNKCCPDYILSILTHCSLDKQKFVNDLGNNWPGVQIILSGIQFLSCDVCFPPNVRLVRSMQEFIEFANQLSKPVPANVT